MTASTLLHSPIRTRRVVVLLALIIWSITLFHAVDTFRPVNGNIDFNSDGAIPVLMANDSRPVTVFDTYYYGADRWGGWPLIIARLVNHATGFRWSVDRLHAARVTWLFLGILVLAMLNRRSAAPVILIGLAVICLSYILRLRLYDLGQVYAWQITSLLFGWLALRKSLESSSAATRHQNWSSLRWLPFVFFLSLLAILSSPVSGPVLCFLAALETSRSLLHAQARSRQVLINGMMALATVVLAIITEVALKTNYHKYGLKHYQEEFKTGFAFDVGYLRTNLKIHLQSVIDFEWSPLILLALMSTVGMAVAVIYISRRRRNSPARVRNFFLDDTTFTIFGGIGIAAVNFVLMTIVDHVRISLYDNRYLTVTFFFGAISGLLVVWRVLKLAVERIDRVNYAEWIFSSALLLALVIAFPRKLDARLYKLRKETASILAQKSPNAILMGGYWETYVFSALQPVNMLMPLPLEGHQVRMPWARNALHHATEVIVEYKSTTKEGDEHTPPERLTQYGDDLRLVNPKWYENDEYAFARYVKEPK
jgi:hypothetical protein